MYYYKFENGHCIVEIGGYKWMIDTGAPSFSFHNNITNVVIDGVTYKINLRPDYKATVEKTVGIPLAGIIGCDILSKTSFSMNAEGDFCFGLDYISTDNYIDVEIKTGVLEAKNNTILGNVNLNESIVKVLFDTGAYINYINSGLVNPSQYQNQDYELIDYDFVGNVIFSKKHLTIGKLGKKAYKILFGIPKDSYSSPMRNMNALGCGAVIGLYNFEFNSPIFFECFGIDYKNKKLYISW